MRILVVEDDLALAGNLARALREESFQVDVAHDSAEALKACKPGKYNLVFLDLMLRGRTGDDVVRHLRSTQAETPILLLTTAGQTERLIALMDAGAHDYMSRPLDLREFIARCQTLISRSKGSSPAIVQFGDLEVNRADHSARWDGADGPVDLTPTEFRILEYMISSPRGVVSKRGLTECLHDASSDRRANVIEVHVSNLRKKLQNAERKRVIRTLRGRGYQLIAT